MQSLRQARFLARLVLVWFAMAIGVAAAAPMVQPQNLQLICSGGTAKLVAQDAGNDQQGDPARIQMLDCPLCATPAAPPPVSAVPHDLSGPTGHVAGPSPSVRLAVLASPPLPARGPPSSL